MSKKKYILDKMSEKGFELTSFHPEIIKRCLESYVCDSCRKTAQELRHELWVGHCGRNQEVFDSMTEELQCIDDNSFPEDYEKRSIEDQINILLGTSCGAEFFLEIEE